MFAFDRDLKEKLGEAVDAIVDFATLGEYGYEPVVERPACKPAPCPGALEPIRAIRTSKLPARMP